MSKLSIRYDSFVEAVQSNPEAHQQVVFLEGYIGKSNEDNHCRVYFDKSLNDFIDVSLADVLHCVPNSKEEDPLGGSKLWVSSTAKYKYGDPAEVKKRPEGSFTEGDVMSAYEKQFYAPAAVDIKAATIAGCNPTIVGCPNTLANCPSIRFICPSEALPCNTFRVACNTVQAGCTIFGGGCGVTNNNQQTLCRPCGVSVFTPCITQNNVKSICRPCGASVLTPCITQNNVRSICRPCLPGGTIGTIASLACPSLACTDRFQGNPINPQGFEGYYGQEFNPYGGM